MIKYNFSIYFLVICLILNHCDLKLLQLSPLTAVVLIRATTTGSRIIPTKVRVIAWQHDHHHPLSPSLLPSIDTTDPCNIPNKYEGTPYTLRSRLIAKKSFYIIVNLSWQLFAHERLLWFHFGSVFLCGFFGQFFVWILWLNIKFCQFECCFFT